MANVQSRAQAAVSLLNYIPAQMICVDWLYNFMCNWWPASHVSQVMQSLPIPSHTQLQIIYYSHVKGCQLNVNSICSYTM